MKEQIRKASQKVKGRIAGFVAYYVFLILLGIGLIWGVVALSLLFISMGGAVFALGRISIFLIILWVAVCIMAVMVGIYLVKPLFSFSRNVKLTRVEVTREESPQLFQMLDQIAAEVGCELPHQVFLTQEVNACVFFNSSLWSLFFPVRKSLEIGLGLFQDMSVQEVKSIIAHELGHVAQDDYKAVRVAYTVLLKLLYEKDAWDRWTLRMAQSGWTLFRWSGIFTIGTTNWIKNLTFKVFKHVERAYMELSRLQEYDADSTACRLAGSSNFVSALCKTVILDERNEAYMSYLSSLIGDDKLVENYFEGKEWFEQLRYAADHHEFHYDTVVDAPIQTTEVESRIKLENVFDSHPSLEDRLANARRLAVVRTDAILQPAWSLLSDDTIKRVSDNTIQVIVNNHAAPVALIGHDEFAQWMQYLQSDVMVDSEMREFFNRAINVFDPDQEEDMVVQQSPFNDANRRVIKEYAKAQEDLHTLRQIQAGEIEAKNISYLGVVYEADQVPLNEHEQYHDALKKRVEEIDHQVYHYMMHQLDTYDATDVNAIYSIMKYVNDLVDDSITHLAITRERIIANAPGAQDKVSFETLRIDVNSYVNKLKYLIESISANRGIFENVVSAEYLDGLTNYGRGLMPFLGSSLDGEAINNMFNASDRISDLLANLMSWCHKRLSNLALALEHGEYTRRTIDPEPDETTQVMAEAEEATQPQETLQDNEVGDKNAAVTEKVNSGNSLEPQKPQHQHSYMGWGIGIIAVLIIVIPIVMTTLTTIDLTGNDNDNSYSDVPDTMSSEYLDSYAYVEDDSKVAAAMEVYTIDETLLAANERTDGYVIFKVPSGWKCTKETVGEGYNQKTVYALDDPGENCQLRLGGYPEIFSLTKSDFDEICNVQKIDWLDEWNGKQLSDKSRNDGTKTIYERMTRYSRHDYNTLIYRIIAIHDSITNHMCIITCLYIQGQNVPIEQFVKDVKFYNSETN